MDNSDQKLVVLENIAQILGETTNLVVSFQQAMSWLGDKLGLERAVLVLLDPATEELRIAASLGLNDSERQLGRYAVGEGVTGRVMETGELAVITDIASHPDFLNRTRSRRLDEFTERGDQVSFICIPVRDGERLVGAISVDKPFVHAASLDEAVQVLKVIAGMFSQSIRIHQLVQVEKDQLLAENERLRDGLKDRYQFDKIIGSSPAMLDVLGTIVQVSKSRATVLILGETGCGKELIARAIHYNSPRADKPMIRVNCGALSPQLLESELFGHKKGAFTGAVSDKVGRFEAADGGTLFLDEIGTLDPQLQVKLLRVLQEREFERVGDFRSVPVNARVIAATNLNLEEQVRDGQFREDLFYRLNVVTVTLPPLRARREDVLHLIDHFLDIYNRENDGNLRKFNRDVLNTLIRYPWPGNVRELQNAVERAVVLSRGEEFTADLLPLQIRLFMQQTRNATADDSIEALIEKLVENALRQTVAPEDSVFRTVVRELEQRMIREALRINDGVKLRTAEYLGLNRNTFNKKVKDYGIDDEPTMDDA